jgi:cysteine synthase A
MVKKIAAAPKNAPKKTEAVIAKKDKKVNGKAGCCSTNSCKPKSNSGPDRQTKKLAKTANPLLNLAMSLARILDQIPAEWHGTTFKNKQLLGREEFSRKFMALVQRRGAKITTKDLTNLGNAEDYLRVSTNISTVYETVLAIKNGYESLAGVFTFSSPSFPWMAVMLTNKKVVHCHGAEPFTADDEKFLALLKCQIKMHATHTTAQKGINISTSMKNCGNSAWDAVISAGVLYINNPSIICPGDILTMRKRMCTPMTSPVCLAALQKEIEIKPTHNTKKATAAQKHKFYTHLQKLTGTR